MIIFIMFLLCIYLLSRYRATVYENKRIITESEKYKILAEMYANDLHIKESEKLLHEIMVQQHLNEGE